MLIIENFFLTNLLNKCNFIFPKLLRCLGKIHAIESNINAILVRVCDGDVV